MRKASFAERFCVECGDAFLPLAGEARRLTCSQGCSQARERARNRLRVYGVTVADYDKMLCRQDGRCAICGAQEEHGGRRMAIDHNHACCPHGRSCGKCVRGLLCNSCNLGLGSFKDDIDRLRAAIQYLRDTGTTDV